MSNKTMTPEQRSAAASRGQDTVRANRERRDREATEWAAQWCPTDHRTWAAKARCLWPRVKVVGEGPVVVRQDTQIILCASLADVPEGTTREQVTVMRKGLHRRGAKVKS
jgi:hypothetical protein